MLCITRSQKINTVAVSDKLYVTETFIEQRKYCNHITFYLLHFEHQETEKFEYMRLKLENTNLQVLCVNFSLLTM